jgi:2',3'-cyclic-nucleotide 2'-phosphodiesterase (5'-nucleotidase family)
MFDADKPWSRREFLKLPSQAGLLSTVPTLASAAAALNRDTVCVSILHTTDLHGHILPTSDYGGNPDRG